MTMSLLNRLDPGAIAEALLEARARTLLLVAPLTGTWTYLEDITSGFGVKNVTVDRGARAYAQAPSAGVVSGTGTVIDALAAADTESRVDSGAVLTASGNVRVESRTVNAARARGQAEALAVASLGSMNVEAKSDGNTSALRTCSVGAKAECSSAPRSVATAAESSAWQTNNAIQASNARVKPARRCLTNQRLTLIRMFRTPDGVKDSDNRNGARQNRPFFGRLRTVLRQ